MFAVTATQKEGRFAGKPYAHPKSFYCKLYGKSLATIKRWWKLGRGLDDVDLMAAELHPPAPTTTGVTAEQPVLGKLPKNFLHGEGILAAIGRLKQAELAAAAEWQAARGYNAKLANVKLKEWVAIQELLRKQEKDEPDIRKKKDLTFDREEVEAAVSMIFQNLRAAINSMPGRAASRLLGLREHDEIMEVMQREAEVLLGNLTETALDAVKQAEDQALGHEGEDDA